MKKLSLAQNRQNLCPFCIGRFEAYVVTKSVQVREIATSKGNVHKLRKCPQVMKIPTTKGNAHKSGKWPQVRGVQHHGGILI